MKAWIVRDRFESYYSTVVFAETRGKAKSAALATDCCEDAHYCDIEARRAPQLDKYHKDGKTEMDWYDPEDRIAMVRDAGFMCDLCEIPESCSDCPAKEFCDHYTDRRDEEE